MRYFSTLALLGSLVVGNLLGNLAWSQAASAQNSKPAEEASTSDKAAAPGSNTAPGDASSSSVDMLPELAPQPGGKTTLIGGMVLTLDRVRDAMTVQPFGGHRLTILFDGRTQVFRDGSKVSQRDLHKGDRVYVDTTLDKTSVFARNIRIQTGQAAGETNGQVLSFDRSRGQLVVNDKLARSVNLRVTPDTHITRDDKATTADALVPGSLVNVKFRSSGDGSGTADEVLIIAAPGTKFDFLGKVTYLDMHSGLLVIVDPRDRKNYEIHFEPAQLKVTGDLEEDAAVAVTATFDGNRYVTSAVAVTSPADR